MSYRALDQYHTCEVCANAAAHNLSNKIKPQILRATMRASASHTGGIVRPVKIRTVRGGAAKASVAALPWESVVSKNLRKTKITKSDVAVGSEQKVLSEGGVSLPMS